MRKHHPENERVKRKYFIFLKEAKRQDDASVDAAAKAISRFEEYTSWKDFKAFHFQQAVGFKGYLAKHQNARTGKGLSKATMNSTLRSLKAFFQWLAREAGYKSRINYSEAEYFNLSEKDVRVATAKRHSRVPTLEQIRKVINTMPNRSVIEQRNRALVAFTLLTGARDSAIASMKLKHVDVESGCVYQDAREVNTKASKTFTTYFFPVGDDIRQIVLDWISYLKTELYFGNDDPLFPKTAVVRGGVGMSLSLPGYYANTGAMPHLSGRYSGRLSRPPDWNTSIRTVSGKRWPNLGKLCANQPNISKPGVRILGMKVC